MAGVFRFNDAGIAEFSRRIVSAKQGADIDFAELLNADGLVEVLPGGVALEADPDALTPSTTRSQAAELLVRLLDPLAELHGYRVDRDRGLWAWLSVLWLPALAPGNPEGLHLQHQERYVPDHDYRKYYRHLLGGPYLVGRAYRNDLDSVMAVLAAPVHQPGEVVAQLTATADLVRSRSIMRAATALYYDPSTRSIRPGAAGKDRSGTARRLVTVLRQLDLTWDVLPMDPKQLLDLLPDEFQPFRS
jgi:hypothetical protein